MLGVIVLFVAAGRRRRPDRRVSAARPRLAPGRRPLRRSSSSLDQAAKAVDRGATSSPARRSTCSARSASPSRTTAASPSASPAAAARRLIAGHRCWRSASSATSSPATRPGPGCGSRPACSPAARSATSPTASAPTRSPTTSTSAAWPPFNLADVAITAGVLLLVYLYLRDAEREPERWLSRSCGSSTSTRPWPWSTSRPAWSSTRRPRTAARPWSASSATSSAAATTRSGPGIVHRLDKGTSGLLVVARNDEAHAALQAQVQRARGRAHLPGPGRRPASPRAPARSTPRSAAPRASATGWRSPAPPRARRAPISRCSSCSPRESYLEARLETGRTHQIRAHFAAIGHPLAGDATYGGARTLRPRAPVPPRPPARLRPPASAASG